MTDGLTACVAARRRGSVLQRLARDQCRIGSIATPPSLPGSTSPRAEPYFIRWLQETDNLSVWAIGSSPIV